MTTDLSVENKSFAAPEHLTMNEQTSWIPRRTRTPPAPRRRTPSPGAVAHDRRPHPGRHEPLRLPLAAGRPRTPRWLGRQTPPGPNAAPEVVEDRVAAFRSSRIA